MPDYQPRDPVPEQSFLRLRKLFYLDCRINSDTTLAYNPETTKLKVGYSVKTLANRSIPESCHFGKVHQEREVILKQREFLTFSLDFSPFLMPNSLSP